MGKLKAKRRNGRKMSSRSQETAAAVAGNVASPWDGLGADGEASPVPPMRRRRILLGAYAASPARGSEPGVGWNVARALAAHHDVTLLCSRGMPGPEHAAFQNEIDAWVRQNGPVPGLAIRYVDRPAWSNLCQRERELHRFTVYYSGYRAWQRAAYREAARLHAQRPFDAAHHLNIVGFREPGYLWRLPVPFFWGPVAGAANVPLPFLGLMGWRDRAAYGVRNVMNEWQKRTSLRCRHAARRASRIWVVGEENRRMARDIWGHQQVEPLLEIGTTPNPAARVKRRDDHDAPLRLVWSGVHIGRKALPILLHALALLRKQPHPPRVAVTILGDGPMTGAWKALAESLGVGSVLTWAGRLPMAEAIDRMAAADAMVSTSVLEATSLVTVESIALGLPVLCHDACGMAIAVTGDCGIKVPMVNPLTSARGYAAAIRRLAEERGLLERLSAGALRRAGELTWESIARTIAVGYDNVLSGAERAKLS